MTLSARHVTVWAAALVSAGIIGGVTAVSFIGRGDPQPPQERIVQQVADEATAEPTSTPSPTPSTSPTPAATTQPPVAPAPPQAEPAPQPTASDGGALLPTLPNTPLPSISQCWAGGREVPCPRG